MGRVQQVKNDGLHQMERNLKVLAEKYVMTAARLIAPAIESSFAVGFDWPTNGQHGKHLNQKNYPKALEFYRRALNQISNTHKEVRIKILQNIEVMGQYPDAFSVFQQIMSNCPKIRAGYNHILCYFATGDRRHEDGLSAAHLCPLEHR